MSGQDVLHRLPGGGVHKGLVRPGVLHALEGDNALVVRVSQQCLQESDGDRVSRFAGSWWDGEAAVVEVLRQLPHRPVPRRILRKSQPDERCPLLIQLNRPDLSSVLIPGTHIHIPQRCLAQCPAVSGFLAHPLDDLIGQVPGVELSDGAHNAVQEHTAGGLVDVLAGRHQPHTGLFEGPVDLHIVRSIAGQAVELVDDDVVNPTIFLEVGQHLLQLRPVRRPGGLAPVGELLDHERTHRLGLALVGFTLSRQGEALLRPTTLGLLAGGDADVGDGALRCQLRGHGGEGIHSSRRRAALHHAWLCCSCCHTHILLSLIRLSGHTSHHDRLSLSIDAQNAREVQCEVGRDRADHR